MSEKQSTNRERMQEITASIEQGIKDLFESEKYMHYLSVMSKFHHYSLNNTMLIFMQRPDATLVAGFQKWKTQFQRHVKKGEHGITIIAPTPYKKKIEAQKLDPETKAPLLDKDGNVLTEEKEIVIPSFRPVTVFDVSQTEGKPLPELVSALTGDVQEYQTFFEALRRSAPVPIRFENILSGAHGYYHLFEKRIAIQEGMSELQTIKTAIHEIAHSKLHAIDPENTDPSTLIDKRTREVQAESVAYTVCQYYGLDTSDYSFAYVAGWSSGKELEELRSSLETINKTACELIDEIDRNWEKCRAQDVLLDQYPMPDPSFAQIELKGLSHDLLPLSRNRASELMGQGLTVYIIQDGENPEAVLDANHLEAHDGFFAVSREEWAATPEFDKLVKERMNHQEEREQAFLAYKGDCFAIYQVKHTDELRDIRYESLEQLQASGQSAQRENYELVYTAPLPPSDLKGDTTEMLFYRFNMEHPTDYRHPSMSVSDIVALKRDGHVSYHYCDSFGFTEIHNFIPERSKSNKVVTTEVLKEKSSIVERLKNQVTPECKRIPSKHTERER